MIPQIMNVPLRIKMGKSAQWRKLAWNFQYPSFIITGFYPVRKNGYSLNEDDLNAYQDLRSCRPLVVHRSIAVRLSLGSHSSPILGQVQRFIHYLDWVSHSLSFPGGGGHVTWWHYHVVWGGAFNPMPIYLYFLILSPFLSNLHVFI